MSYYTTLYYGSNKALSNPDRKDFTNTDYGFGICLVDDLKLARRISSEIVAEKGGVETVTVFRINLNDIDESYNTAITDDLLLSIKLHLQANSPTDSSEYDLVYGKVVTKGMKSLLRKGNSAVKVVEEVNSKQRLHVHNQLFIGNEEILKHLQLVEIIKQV